MDDVPAFWIVLAVVSFVMALFGAWVAAQKGRSAVEGLILGALFGPLGILVVALLPTPPPKPAGPKRWEKPLRGVVNEAPAPAPLGIIAKISRNLFAGAPHTRSK